ncbi:hypothetical protein ACG04R_23970 [Roseateles sp. BYS78W]|uniref:Uncharacterized protein n=1 Tax=Pelomonas candidula TaxID=3299025 RepID=A0ABW7HIL5_9BURK
MPKVNTSLGRRTFTKLVLAMAATSMASLAYAQIGGKPEAPNSQNFGSDGTRERLIPNIKKFFGQAKGQYIDLRPEREKNSATVEEAESASQQFLRIFNDRPGGIVNLPDGNQITFGTQTHDTSNMAVVVTPSGSNTIIAAGMLHTRCGKYNGAPLGSKEFKKGLCENKQTFTIFWGKDVAPSQEINKELRDWIVTLLKDQAKSERTPRYGKLGIEVRRLG